MPIRAHIPSGCFSQDEIDILTAAFERSLTLLRLKDRNDPLIEIVAKRVVEIAQSGEMDSAVITEMIVSEYPTTRR
jgi:hypothetical protein